LSVLIFKGNNQVEHLSPTDRGLAYGDGVFETLLAVHGKLIWWQAHWQRLVDGANRLGIEPPNEAMIKTAAMQLAGMQRVVVKIILTRGDGGRGYAPSAGPTSTIVSVHSAPDVLKTSVAVRWCQTQISQQPVLAGIKHLNRLENVMARAEWQDKEFFEGLMCDLSNNVICATAGNIFIYSNHKWRTPNLATSGINGIARQWFLDNCANIVIEQISRSQLENADAVFICNSVRGMMEVNRINAIVLTKHVAFSELYQQFMFSNPEFSIE
jgi:4-amino-4-deoxychorismate lyase